MICPSCGKQIGDLPQYEGKRRQVVDIPAIVVPILGTKYSEMNSDQLSSTIIKGTILEDIACPIKNIRYRDVLKNWEVNSMFPSQEGLEVAPIRLMLPIQIKDIVNEYIFEFDVNYVYNYHKDYK